MECADPTPLRLPASLAAFPSPTFSATLLQELATLPATALPLQQGLTRGGVVDDTHLTFSLLHLEATAEEISVRVGALFTEIVINCGCGDEPHPLPAWCELEIRIHRQSAATRITLIDPAPWM